MMRAALVALVASAAAERAAHKHLTAVGLTAKIERELSEAHHKAHDLLAGHPHELHKLNGLLQQAAKMAHRAGQSERLATTNRQRFQLLQEKGTARVNTSAFSQQALLNFADGLSAVSRADKELVGEAKQAKNAVEELIDENPGAEKAMRLLTQVQRSERYMAASEAREARRARHEAREAARHPQQHNRGPMARHAAHAHQSPAQKKLAHIKKAFHLSAAFAERELHLEDVDKRLLKHVEHFSEAAAKELRDGNRADEKTASALLVHMTQAKMNVEHLAAFHGRLADEAKDRAGRLLEMELKMQDAMAEGEKHQQRHHRHHQRFSFTQQAARSEMKAAQRAQRELKEGRKVLAETVLAEDAVEDTVKGSAEAAKVRNEVTEALRRAEKMEERQVEHAAESLRRHVK